MLNDVTEMVLNFLHVIIVRYLAVKQRWGQPTYWERTQM